MASPGKKGSKSKKKVKKVESEGVAHVKASFNNTLVTITDLSGNVLLWSSAGKCGFKGSKRAPRSPQPSLPIQSRRKRSIWG